MTEDPAPEPIVVALAVREPRLADRLAALLADVPSLRLAVPGEAADVVLTLPEPTIPIGGRSGPDPA